MQKWKNNQFINPAKNAHNRLFWVAACVSSLFSILILSLLFSIGSNEHSPEPTEKSKDIIDLLSASQTASNHSINSDQTQAGMALPKGGWVQQTDKYGNLEQQYRCDSLDPNPASLPNGWIKMTRPEVELFLSDSQIIRITGESGIANAPNRTLEAGEISGNVQVSLFEVEGDQPIKKNAAPSVVLTTKRISFDNFIGEITCEHQVQIVSPQQKLVGRQLTVRFNDQESRIEYLRLKELDYIELLPIAADTSTAKISPLPKNIAPSPKSLPHRIKAGAVGDAPEYYIASLTEQVQINQGLPSTGRIAQANKLTIAFSNKQNSNVNNAKFPSLPSSMLATKGMPAAIAAISIASLQPDANQMIRITCNGGLTMVPLSDPSLMPQTPEDTRLELFGSSDEPVFLQDDLQGIEATGEFFQHHVGSDRIDLYGRPALLLMNEMVTTTEHFWLATQDGKGAAEGSGTMANADQEQPNTILEWSEGVDFFFNSSADEKSGDLKSVICHGDVLLSSDDSEITCKLLEITFAKDKNGSSTPSLAIATGNVIAKSDTQILFSDETRLTFKQDSGVINDSDTFLGGSKADKLSAKGNVQVLLNDGGRAFCDQLDGDISQDAATLTGNVLIAYERMLMNKGELASLTLDRISGKGTWKGPGQALFLENALDVLSDDRIKRPSIQTNDQEAANFNHISMRANWNTAMRLDQTFNDGAGSLDLAGNVDVRSKKSSLERGQITGEDLRLEFDYLDNKDELQNSSPEIRRVIARNNAQIEHRLWEAENAEATPVVYYIGGEHIEFDTFTRETIAVGKGELVLRDPRTPKQGSHQSALAGRGTTRFTWDKKLTTTKITNALYRIVMNGDVEMVHQGLDEEIGALTADSITAFAQDPNPEIVNNDSASKLSFRAMDLQQINSAGSVYVATATRKVDCDLFDYNLLTGIAELSALENRSVSIVTQGASYPVRATSITWNMDPSVDTISVHGLQGSGSN